MNCANHPQTPAAAYCRTCGKALCTNCTRQVMGVIYCENCLAERVAGTVPQTTYQQAVDQGPGMRVPPTQGLGPNPALAGILGAIPFGVGAIYCGQYVKGLVHLGIFIFLVVAESSDVPDYLHIILGFLIAFFVFYQIIDSVRTAKAIQSGQPVPDPFGFVAAFSPGTRPRNASNVYKGVPSGALVLIGLGVLFLLHNLGLPFLRPGVVGSLVLIALGVWLYTRQLELETADRNWARRGILGPAVLVTIGIQVLFHSLDIISFWRGFPALLIVIGVAIVIQRSSATASTYPPQSRPSPGETQGVSENATDATHSSEMKNG